eukprot:TRINITY_DN676_c1_g1_i1.p1 TRINITY_DN676_c1_g1~~TRINITY_DN676_c1_g1_i1.p1  ORF type:complete len:219 (+),score=44.59 TRINITY_DN676_c1_g1_i1:65-721(+)
MAAPPPPPPLPPRALGSPLSYAAAPSPVPVHPVPPVLPAPVAVPAGMSYARPPPPPVVPSAAVAPPMHAPSALRPAALPAPGYPALPYYPPTQPVPVDHPDHLRHLTVAKYDASAAAHAASFEAASVRAAEIDAAKAAAARYDTMRLADRSAALSAAVRDSTASFHAGNYLMDRAVSVVDGCTYRTRYSPSSAYGPCGPYGPTAEYVSPYVAGSLHLR